MMTTEYKPKINNIEDLQLERAKLRAKIDALEIDLKEHYQEIADKVKSVTRIFGLISRVKEKLGINESNQNNDEPKNYLNTAVKVALPLVAGGLIAARGKRMILRSLIGYGLGQFTKYVVSKNVDEHVASVKGIFSRKQEKYDDKGIF